jgi:hypothetical protein
VRDYLHVTAANIAVELINGFPGTSYNIDRGTSRSNRGVRPCIPIAKGSADTWGWYRRGPGFYAAGRPQ